MKFICPNCSKETEIEVVMIDCTVTETIKYNNNGELEYGTPEIHESLNAYYQCKNAAGNFRLNRIRLMMTLCWNGCVNNLKIPTGILLRVEWNAELFIYVWPE